MNDQAQVLDDRGSLDFRTSFLKTRLIVGLIGVALPIVLVVFDRVIFGATSFRDSLSAYYYSGCATGSSEACAPSEPDSSSTWRPRRMSGTTG